MKQEILIQKCSQHDLETIAFDMNPNADPSCRNCCIYCFQDPLKAQYYLSLKEARIDLLNAKKTFKQKKETQIQNNISILKELDKNISELKNMYVQIFDQIKESINHQIQKYQEQNSNLEQKVNLIDLDSYLSNKNDFEAESLTNLKFKEKCLNLLESIFSQSNNDQCISKGNELDDQSVLFQSERNIEKNSQNKKKALLSFKCKKHDEEIRWYNEGQSKLFEDRLLCDECSIDQKGPFKTILSIHKDWEQQKITQIQYIKGKKNYQKELNIVINEIINTLEKEDNEQQNIYRSKINKLEQDWCTLSKQQLIKIINNLYQPLLRDNKKINSQLKQEQKMDQLNSLLNNQLTLLIKIIKNNLQVIMKSLNYDYNLLKVIQQEESNVIEQESQTTTQETNSIQCQTVRFSKIQYINEFIMKLPNIEQKLKQQQFNEAFLKDLFNKINSLFKLIKQDKGQFKEFCNQLIIIIQQEFKKNDLQISNEEENKNKYIKKLLKYPQNSQEFFLLQDIFPQEQLTLFFDPIKGDVIDYTYYQNFLNSIEDRINSSSKKQILLFNKFYQLKVTIKWITLKDFMSYIEKDILAELEAYCKGNYQYQVEIFLNSFADLGFEIVKKNVSELIKTLPQWFQSEKKQQLLRSCFKQNKNVNNLLGNWRINEDKCPNFFKYLQQKEEYLQLMEYDQVTGLIQQYQNDNKLIYELNIEVVTIKNIDEIILNEKLNDCKLKLNEHMGQVKEPIYKTLEYVQEKSYENKMVFQIYIPVVIEVAMSQNDNEGWKQIQIEIDEIILDELQIKKDNSIIENEQNLNITQYRRQQIQMIISKIKEKINNFNLYFSNFGVILNDFGIKCIFQYAFFVIWRFLCIEEISKQKQVEEQQFNQQYFKFQIDISENRIEKSRYFGNQLAENIQLQSIQKLCVKYSMYQNEILGDFPQEQSSFDLIKKLDNQILLGKNKNVTDKQIYEYVGNQTNYIVKYIRQKILNIKQKLSDQIKDELTLILKQTQKNLKHLCEFDNYPQNIHDYFDQLKDPDQALDLLLQIVVNCLQGQINQQLLNMIKPEYRDKFKNIDFQIFSDQLCNYDELDIQIHDLYTFTLAFQQKIDSIISELKDFQIDFQKLDIKSQLENIEMKLIGCLEQCPMCGRKCDSELYDKQHQHQCKNGHQLIVMNINNQNKFPFSLYSCEELQDDYIIFENKPQTISWNQIKKLNQSWTFSFPNIQQQKEIQTKFIFSWNYKIGRLISSLQGFTFYKKRDYTITTNYILIIEKQNVRESREYLIPFLKMINNNPDNRITIIQFQDIKSIFVVDREPLNPEVQIQKLDSFCQYQYQDIFQLVHSQIIINYHNFKEHQIFIYADSYEGVILSEKFKSINYEKTRIITCQRNYCFKQQEQQRTYTCGEVKHEEIGQIWIETVPKQL